MKIYPDPELPDVEVNWYDGDCVDGTGDVEVEMIGVDDASERYTTTVVCRVAKTTFVNVSRQRFHVTGKLHDDAGGVFSAAEADVDLRNGYDESAYMFFGGSFSNYRVGWTFDMGATCESIGADAVEVLFSINGQVFSGMGEFCDFGALTGSMPPGVYSVTAEAFTQDNLTVATSLVPIDGANIGNNGITDIGTIVLTPCGSSCPDL